MDTEHKQQNILGHTLKNKASLTNFRVLIWYAVHPGQFPVFADGDLF